VNEIATMGTPLWWVQKLERELDGRRTHLEQLEAFYEGNHPHPFLTKTHQGKLRDEFRELIAEARTNFMRLVVDAVEERMRVEGFRLSASEDATADQESWKIWQANQMDANAPTAMLEALVKGVSYLSVWQEPDAEYPTIAIEDALETIVAYRPGSNFRLRDAALKVWRDEDAGIDRANLFLPAAIYKFERKRESNQRPGTEKYPWTLLPEDAGVVDNPLQVVPIIPLRNRPRLRLEGESEISDLIPIQRQINGFTFLLALVGYFGAHRQRWAVGLTLEEDENGKTKSPFDVAIDRLWVAEGENVKFGDFAQTDPKPYTDVIEQKILHIAVTSRTPRHYLVQSGQSPSGDAIRSAESGLVKKALRKQGPFGEAFEEALNLARRFQGAAQAAVDSEIVWAAPDTPTLAETTDAVIKQFQAGLIPWEAALEKLGYTQTQIARFASMRQGDALIQALLNPAGVEPATEQAALNA